MRAKEIVCLAILPEDVERAFHKVLHSQKQMDAQTVVNSMQHMEKEICREAVLLSLSRFLRTHGLAHSTHPHIGENCITIHGKIIHLVFFAVSGSKLAVEELVECPVLLDSALWQRKENFHRFLFLFVNEAFNITLHIQLSALHSGHIHSQDFHLAFAEHRLFLTAAPTVAECRKKFQPIPKGSVCLQAPWGLEEAMLGARNKILTPFVAVFDWHGV